MMKKLELFLILLFVAAFLLPMQTSADTINDHYIGATPTHDAYNGMDLIGSQNGFNISKMEVSFVNGMMTVDIYSTYFDNIGLLGTSLGDLFISTDGYHPMVSSELDNYINGERWEYAFVLDEHSGASSSGSVSAYAVDQSLIELSSAPAGYIYRQDQEVRYSAPNTESLGNGEWTNHDTYLSISMDVANIDWDWSGESDLGFHWTMSCGNDVIEGKVPAPVPEPATMLLFGTGLIGMSVVGRKTFHKRS